jgi:hypothetical protein
MRMRRDKTGDVLGSSELAIVVFWRSWREISLWKAGDRHTANAVLTFSNASDKTLVFWFVRGTSPSTLLHRSWPPTRPPAEEPVKCSKRDKQLDIPQRPHKQQRHLFHLGKERNCYRREQGE